MPVPVITVAEMRAWEASTWASGQTEAAVIARVGEQLARRAMETTRPGSRILIIAGSGHNGDDARAMLPHLNDRNVQVMVVRDPAIACAELSARADGHPDLIVDGLFGIGLNRPLSHEWLQLIARINHMHTDILSVDVPSGLDADTGRVTTAAIQATETLTVGAPKRGLLTLESGAYVGRLVVLPDVGLVPCPFRSDLQWTLPGDFETFPPRRIVTTHKGTFGHLGIVAGSRGFHGASVLAARGAQRARPGLVTVFAQPETYVPVAAQLQAAMVQVWTGQETLDRFTALLYGPGLAAPDISPSVQASVRKEWRELDAPIVVDASALPWVEPGPIRNDAARVITPHPGEAASLLGVATADVQADRPAAARALSRKFGGCWVVLKGHQTIIGGAEGDLFVNCSGCPGLAQGGSGDLLSGYIAGWLAQPLLRGEALQAIRFAVFEHGAAADRLDKQRGSWVVEELAAELGRELK